MTTSVHINDHDVTIAGTLVREARLAQEWFEDVERPEELIAALAKPKPRADILTFWQRLPDTVPRYHYHMQWDEVAALPVSTYANWWSKQIKSRTRGLIRKAANQGVVVKEADYTDDFVRGMTRIFNETPMRQGRPFRHYGKDFDTIKRQFSRYLHRELLLGAYYEDELIGFMMIGMAGNYAVTGQIISMVSHRGKGTNNCLVAKAVDICARDHIPYLVYLKWGSGSLAEFKRRCGFERTRLPRYYVPLTTLGWVALRAGLHKGVVPRIPAPMLLQLKGLRARWYRSLYALRYRQAFIDRKEL